MCIEVKNIFPKRAKTDIVCYKLLKEDMTAPYPGFTYDFKEYKANVLFILLKDIKNFIIEKPYSLKGGPYYYYSIGLLHTYKKSALPFVINQCKYLKRRLFKCIIPKGTYYYESSDFSKYASRKLRIVEEISDMRMLEESYIKVER